LPAQAAPHAKAVRSEPPAHTAGDIGQLPREVEAALQRAKVPNDNFHVMVVDTSANSTPRLSHQAHVRVNPASLMKLATTTAAIDTLGPAFVWRTPVYIDGRCATVCCTATCMCAAAGTHASWWNVCGC
jgi:D-alanyl-D-alanine carboxypeptidase/D-alanyl-D-alanine-endopeptidase (penicillin-binding protein 4)